MRALQIHTQQPIEQSPLAPVDLPIPEPGPGQVRLRVRVCGVCHTDLHIAEGDIHPPRLPIVPGHQVVGVVEAVGPTPTPSPGVRAVFARLYRRSPVRKNVGQGRGDSLPLSCSSTGGGPGRGVGARVGIPWLHAACGQCEFCQRGEENLCPDARFTGFHVNGGYAETMLADARYVLPLPDAISDEQAAPLLCAGIIGYRSLRKAEVQPGERLGLVGFGASAHLTIQVALHWGCEVYVFTRSPQHRRHAGSLGAAWTGGLEDPPPKPLDRAITFAPAGSLIPLVLAKIRPGGSLAINAVHLSPIPEMPYALIYGERTLRSVANATYRDGVEFLQLAVEIPIRAEVSLYPLIEANRALSDLKHSRINGEAVLRVETSRV